MASVRRLKKNVASVLGKLVDTLIIWELVTDKRNEQSRGIVEEIYLTYDKYLEQINHPTENKGSCGNFCSQFCIFHRRTRTNWRHYADRTRGKSIYGIRNDRTIWTTLCCVAVYLNARCTDRTIFESFSANLADPPAHA